MQELSGIEGLSNVPPNAVVSIGNFDGMHLGHVAIVDKMRTRRAGRETKIAAVTFEPHPLTVLRPALAPPRLTPPALKHRLLSAMDVDYLVTLPPTPDVLGLTAEEFFAILRDRVRPAHLVEGTTFNFGKNRGGTIDRLREWSAGTGMTLHTVAPVSAALLDCSVVPVSSSLIRWLLMNGRVRDAAICLGRPFAIAGEVVQGFQRGRTIGVPTANLRVVDQLVPDDAVYAGRCTVNGTTYACAVNIGALPTFEKDARQIEAHLVDFDGDLYGVTLEVELIDYLRPQFKFPGIDALKAQLKRDIAEASQLATRDPSQPIVRTAEEFAANEHE